MKLSVVSCLLLVLCLTRTQAVGNLEDMDPNSEELKPVVQFAEQMLDKAVNSLYVHRIGTVLKAQKQIVSGIKYYIEFEFKETTCLKNKPNDGVCNPTVSECFHIFRSD